MEFIVKDSMHYTDVGQDFDKDEEKRNQERSTLERKYMNRVKQDEEEAEG